MTIEPSPVVPTAAHLAGITWLWKLFFLFLLGPILLFPERFPLWLVFLALGLLLLPWLITAIQTRRLLPPSPVNFLPEQGLALAPTQGLQWRQLGDLYLEIDDWQSAAHAYDQACLHVDIGRNGCILAAAVYMQHEQVQQAEHYYRQALQQIPAWPPALRGLADALLAQDRVQEALPYLDALTQQGDTAAQEQLRRLQQ